MGSWRWLVGVGVLTTLAACGGGSYSSGPGSQNPGGGSTSSSISVADNSFTPGATTITVGTAVTWTWSGNNRHNVTFDDGTASTTQTTGTYVRTFSAAGTFAYHCTIHGSGMSGSVTVN